MGSKYYQTKFYFLAADAQIKRQLNNYEQATDLQIKYRGRQLLS